MKPEGEKPLFCSKKKKTMELAVVHVRGGGDGAVFDEKVAGSAGHMRRWRRSRGSVEEKEARIVERSPGSESKEEAGEQGSSTSAGGGVRHGELHLDPLTDPRVDFTLGLCYLIGLLICPLFNYSQLLWDSCKKSYGKR